MGAGPIPTDFRLSLVEALIPSPFPSQDTSSLVLFCGIKPENVGWSPLTDMAIGYFAYLLAPIKSHYRSSELRSPRLWSFEPIRETFKLARLGRLHRCPRWKISCESLELDQRRKGGTLWGKW